MPVNSRSVIAEAVRLLESGDIKVSSTDSEMFLARFNADGSNRTRAEKLIGQVLRSSGLAVTKQMLARAHRHVLTAVEIWKNGRKNSGPRSIQFLIVTGRLHPFCWRVMDKRGIFLLRDLAPYSWEWVEGILTVAWQKEVKSRRLADLGEEIPCSLKEVKEIVNGLQELCSEEQILLPEKMRSPTPPRV